jgi:hypothetical protein
VRNQLIHAVAALAAAICVPTPELQAARRIEAIEGKQYTITKKHGPWMIMVAAFGQVRDEELRRDGISERDAALKLVYELRKTGIPAYIYEQEGEIGHVDTKNRMRQTERRVYAARRPMISVLAGNYTSTEDSTARRTLEYIKNNFKAEFLLESGGRYRPTPGKPSPLSGAFFTVNPLLSPEEVNAASIDPLLLKLNSQYNYSLFENKHEYTLVIATYSGRSVAYQEGAEDKHVKNFKVSDSLDKAAQKANELAHAMRNARKFGYVEDYEVYVWHDKYKSVVTVGGFDSPRDPRIQELLEQYSSKQKANPNNPSESVLVAEYFTIPKTLDITQAEKYWLFDPAPRVMKVPRVSHRR